MLGRLINFAKLLPTTWSGISRSDNSKIVGYISINSIKEPLERPALADLGSEIMRGILKVFSNKLGFCQRSCSPKRNPWSDTKIINVDSFNFNSSSFLISFPTCSSIKLIEA